MNAKFPLAELMPFLDTLTLADLGPQRRPGAKTPAEIESALRSVFERVDGEPVRKELIRGLILLWHDELEASHEIAQRIRNENGSVLHAMMHRREPDYSNAKYWLRRVGAHPLFEGLGKIVSQKWAGGVGTIFARIAPQRRWDPFGFVDACERAERSGEEKALLQEIQKIEFGEFLGLLCAR